MSVCLVHVNVAAYYSMKSNKYEVRVDATDEAEANFQASQINKKFSCVRSQSIFDTLFRGECKADLSVKLVRQRLSVSCIKNSAF